MKYNRHFFCQGHKKVYPAIKGNFMVNLDKFLIGCTPWHPSPQSIFAQFLSILFMMCLNFKKAMMIFFIIGLSSSTKTAVLVRYTKLV